LQSSQLQAADVSVEYERGAGTLHLQPCFCCSQGGEFLRRSCLFVAVLCTDKIFPLAELGNWVCIQRRPSILLPPGDQSLRVVAFMVFYFCKSHGRVHFELRSTGAHTHQCSVSTIPTCKPTAMARRDCRLHFLDLQLERTSCDVYKFTASPNVHDDSVRSQCSVPADSTLTPRDRSLELSAASMLHQHLSTYLRLSE
jgi:hypothetical protein